MCARLKGWRNAPRCCALYGRCVACCMCVVWQVRCMLHVRTVVRARREEERELRVVALLLPHHLLEIRPCVGLCVVYNVSGCTFDHFWRAR